MDASLAAMGRPPISRTRQASVFVRHYIEMCVAMCIGFGIGDAVYFRLAGAAGYDNPFAELPVISLAVVAVAMTVPMVAWMRYRGMSWRLTNEMAAGMGVEAILLLALGLAGAVAMGQLALLEHGLMMPFMLGPMLLRLGHYTGREGHTHAANQAAQGRHIRRAST